MMTTLVRPRDVAPPREPRASAPPPAALDAWPHTGRPMPWLVAAFMFMVYLIPFDSTLLPISLPFNSGLDRLVLIVISVIWLIVSLVGRQAPRFRHSPINVAMYLFFVVGVVSLVVNLRDLNWDSELSPSYKQFLLTCTYLLFFYVVASSLEREDIRGFCKLLVFLGALSAIGTIVEYRAHKDLFDNLAHLIPGARVHSKHFNPSPFVRHSAPGPTKHGLADASLLVAPIPFAMTYLAYAKTNGKRILYGLCLLLLVTGCISTEEKSGLILLVATLATVVAYRPRRYLKWWPMLIVAIIAIRVISPHSISGLRYQFVHLDSSTSTSGRTTDYPAVAPFLDTHLLFGRGFGSFDPHKYRILDDQMLKFLIEIGAVGLLLYAALILTPGAFVHRWARRGSGLENELMIGVVAESIAFLLSNFLYDSFDFRQGPYVFFFVAALAAAAHGRPSEPAVEARAAPT